MSTSGNSSLTLRMTKRLFSYILPVYRNIIDSDSVYERANG